MSSMRACRLRKCGGGAWDMDTGTSNAKQKRSRGMPRFAVYFERHGCVLLSCGSSWLSGKVDTVGPTTKLLLPLLRPAR